MMIEEEEENQSLIEDFHKKSKSQKQSEIQPHKEPKNSLHINVDLNLEKNDEVLEKLKESSIENKICSDCGSHPTNWASVSYGIFLCAKCAGVHRSFGVDISFVRSISLDIWKPRQLEKMKKGGNRRAKEHFKLFLEGNPNLSLKQKYSSSIAKEYREILEKEVNEILGEEPKVNTERKIVPEKYKNAKSISSDEYFGNQKKESSCCTLI